MMPQIVAEAPTDGVVMLAVGDMDGDPSVTHAEIRSGP
jgi:hypothetical protein